MNTDLGPRRVAYVSNICPHYRVKTYEALAKCYEVDFFFYSEGGEDYWERRTGLRVGSFKYEYLHGFYITRKLRIVPSLMTRLWSGNYDVVVKCINGRFALPITYLMARIRGKPFVLWTGLWSHPRTIFHRLTFPVTKYVYNHSDAIVVYGRHVKTYLVSLGVNPGKIFEAWHAHDNEQFRVPVAAETMSAIRLELGLGGKKVVLFVGRLEPVKGLRYLINAFAQLGRTDAVLVLVGTGAEETALKGLVRKLGLSNVIFVGYIPVEQLNPYYAIADIFVLPSVTVAAGRELWGLVINEAMNFGLPIVATDAVGAAVGGLLLDGVNGLVVREQDSAQLSGALAALLLDDELRARMGRAARESISQWDNERMVEGFRSAIDYAYAVGRCDAKGAI